MGESKTSKYYASHPEARKRRVKQQAEYNKKPSQIKRRVELNKANRKSQDAGKSRVGDSKDMSHTKSGKLVLESLSRNRSRNGEDGKSTKK